MRSRSTLSVLFKAAVLGCFTVAVGLSAGRSGAPKVGFSSIQPIIKAKCVGCHNGTRHPEKVDLSSYDSLMKSGEKGPIVVPGKPLKSSLLLYVDGTKQPRMPFRQAPLSKREIGAFKAWIAAGAHK